MNDSAPPQPTTNALATLIQLARRARAARDAAELAFIAVNETHALTPYRQAALWLNEGGLAALSGVVEPEANAPYVQWLKRVFQHLQAAAASMARTVTTDDLPADAAADWAEWLPAHVAWLPIPAAGWQFPGGALLLARDEPWSEIDLALLGEWCAAWGQARALRARMPWPLRLARTFGAAPLPDAAPATRSRAQRLLRNRTLWFGAALAALLLMPVRLTVLAPAELVPLNPAVIRAPLDGVLDRILVTPNQAVKEGDPLFEFDRANLANRLQIAQRALATVQAEYRQKAQQALFDPASKTQLAVLQGQIAEKSTEVAYLRKLNERGVVTAPRDGLVLFDGPTEWAGRPVVTGERVMVVADAHAVEIEAWLSPADSIPLPDGARLTLHLNADPLKPVAGTLRYISHEAMARPDGTYAYRVRASLVPAGLPPRVGLKGTAKLEGERVSLAYWMLRRPLAAARAWLGI